MRTLIILFFLTFTGCALEQTQTPNAPAHRLIPPDQAVLGKTQREWSQLWWQWAGSFDRADSPVADLTGERCALKQDGDVWFLAGTYGTRRTVRTCQVPAGKFLFFPLINYIVLPFHDRPNSCLSIMRQAADLTSNPSALLLDIDGVPFSSLVSHRQATPGCFDMGARTAPYTKVFPSAANGYYVMISPLPPGTHTLNFGGVLSGMQQAVTYTLEVK